MSSGRSHVTLGPLPLWSSGAWLTAVIQIAAPMTALPCSISHVTWMLTLRANARILCTIALPGYQHIPSCVGKQGRIWGSIKITTLLRGPNISLTAFSTWAHTHALAISMGPFICSFKPAKLVQTTCISKQKCTSASISVLQIQKIPELNIYNMAKNRTIGHYFLIP